MPFNVNRTPGQNRRTGRNFDKLKGDTNVVGLNGAIQIDEETDTIVLVIATGEPFAQTSAGLTLTLTAGELLVTSSSLGLDPAVLAGVEKRRTHHRFEEGAALGQVQAEEAAEEAIVTAATVSFMGL